MIERIDINNYKSIREASIYLSRINILIGENGAGKSNFISFFELLKAIYDKRLGAYMLTNGGIGAQLHRGLKFSESISGLVDYDNLHAFFFELRPGIGEKAYIEISGDRYNSQALGSKNYSAWETTVWDTVVEESGMSSIESPSGDYIKGLFGSFVVYHFHDTSKTSPLRQPCKLGDDSRLRADGSNLPAVLYRLKHTAPVAYRLIEATVRSVAPYFKRFKLAPMATDPSRIRLEWEEEQSDMYLDATSLSDGALRFIALATLLAQPNLPETIIIDEPELGLHPAAMVKLAAMLRRASLKTQLIIATQSVELINRFSLDDLIIVGRDKEQSTFRRLNAEDFKHWLDDYTIGELWEKNILGGRP